MKKVSIILSAVAFIIAIAGASATSVLLDPPVRAMIGGTCQAIPCTTMARSTALCTILPDDGNFFPSTDINCVGFPLSTTLYVRVSQ